MEGFLCSYGPKEYAVNTDEMVLIQRNYDSELILAVNLTDIKKEPSDVSIRTITY